MSKKLPAVHPGEVLREVFLVPMRLSPYAIARVVGVARTKAFRTTPAFLDGPRVQYDIGRTENEG
jgi:plasmid maintenance system antidote protein VapI